MIIKSNNCTLDYTGITNLLKHPLNYYIHNEDRDNNYLLKLQKETRIKQNRINNFFVILLNFTDNSSSIESILGDTLYKQIYFTSYNLFKYKTKEEISKFKDKHESVLNMMLAAILEAKLLDSTNENNS